MTSSLDRFHNLEKAGAVKEMPSSTAKNQQKGLILSVLVGLLFILVKFKGLALLILSKLKFLLVFAKFLKLGKFATTFSSMAISAAFYSQRFGWAFAVGLVLLILVHELGHGYFAKRIGLPVGAPIFIPFFGAFIALKQFPKTPWVNSFVGMGGPIFGALGGLVLLALYYTNLIPEYSGLLIGLVYFCFAINLFNLIPVFGLDGDRISDPLTNIQFVLLTLILILLTVALSIEHAMVEPSLFIISLLLFCKSCSRIFKSKKPKTALEKLHESPTEQGREEVKVSQTWMAFAAYSVLAVGLGILSSITHAAMLTFINQ